VAKHQGRDYVLLRTKAKVGQIPTGVKSAFTVIGIFTVPLAIIGLISAGRRPGAYMEVGRR